MKSNTRNQYQTAYQVLVSSNQEQIQKNTGDVWDTGKVKSDRSIQIVYNGKPLESEKKYYWKVRVWDKIGKLGFYSDPAFFTMGLLQPEDWKAKWIVKVLPDE